ncbi:MAG TPA: DUF6443 domain-containing protein, partial [Chitinophagaceae bacterium]|nr:DUF6443 domain-containing protein [Chitinophagaceae bacterium]
MRLPFIPIMIALCVPANFLQAQNLPVPNIVATPLFTPKPVIASYSTGLKLNLITSRTAIEAISDMNVFYEADIDKVHTETAFFDGLGRPIQTVQSKASPIQQNGVFKDIITINDYEESGKQKYTYLPFSSANQPQPFRYNAFEQQHDFNAAYNTGEQFFYGKTVTENSMSGRITRSMAAGNSWVGSEKGVITDYSINTSVDEVPYWNGECNAFSLDRHTINHTIQLNMFDAGELAKI